MRGGNDDEPVAAVLGRLRFTSSSAPAIYLNEQLADEMFVAQLGAVGEFTRSAARNLEGQAGPAVVRVGASRESSEQVTYELGNPLTKALILHSALGGAAAAADQSRPGTFVEVVGPMHAPGVRTPADPDVDGDLIALVAAEAERQAGVLRAFSDADTVLVPLLILAAAGPVGAVVDRRWFRPGFAASYAPYPQVAFGLLERADPRLPLMTLIYLRPYL